MSRGMIIGHSFVAGLAGHLAGQHGLPDGTHRCPSEVASDLRVSDQMNGVFLSGVRGASLCDGRFDRIDLIDLIDTLRPRQNGHYFAHDIFKNIKTFELHLKMTLKIVPKGAIWNRSALVGVMAWCRTGDRPLCGPVMAWFSDAYISHWASVS